MDPPVSEQSRPRTYLLGRRFRLRPGEDTMGVDVIDRDSHPIPENDQEIDLNKEERTTIGDRMAALWLSLTTRQPGGFVMEKLRRAQAVLIDLLLLWLFLWFYHKKRSSKSRNFYGKDLRYPTMFDDNNRVWRNPRAGQYHIAYQDPSPDPRWRMKQIVEFVDDRDVGRTFQISGSNMVCPYWDTSKDVPLMEFHSERARCRLLSSLLFFQNFLTRTFLEDYNGHAYTTNYTHLRCAFLVRHVDTNRAESDGKMENPSANQRSVRSGSNEGLASDYKSTGSEVNEVCGEGNNSTGSGINDGSSSNSSGSSNHGEDLESDKLLEEYARDIVDPLKELLLENHIDTIKSKLLAFDPEQRYPGGDIQRLIDQCDWPGLYAAIQNDRRLSIDLFKQKPVVPQAFTDRIKGYVWTGMNKVRDKYFTKSKDGSKYTISKYALRLSAKKALPSGNINGLSRSTSVSASQEDWGRVSWRGIRNLFNKTFAGRLAGPPRSGALRPEIPTASGMAKESEKHPLLRPEDQLLELAKAE